MMQFQVASRSSSVSVKRARYLMSKLSAGEFSDLIDQKHVIQFVLVNFLPIFFFPAILLFSTIMHDP